MKLSVKALGPNSSTTKKEKKANLLSLVGFGASYSVFQVS